MFDTRYPDEAVNNRPNVFTLVLKPKSRGEWIADASLFGIPYLVRKNRLFHVFSIHTCVNHALSLHPISYEEREQESIQRFAANGASLPIDQGRLSVYHLAQQHATHGHL